jgi:hypothetical protein
MKSLARYQELHVQAREEHSAHYRNFLRMNFAELFPDNEIPASGFSEQQLHSIISYHLYFNESSRKGVTLSKKALQNYKASRVMLSDPARGESLLHESTSQLFRIYNLIQKEKEMEALKTAATAAVKPVLKTLTKKPTAPATKPAVSATNKPATAATATKPPFKVSAKPSISAGDADYTKVGTGIRPTVCHFIAERKWSDAEIMKKTSELVSWTPLKSRVEMNRDAMNEGKRESLGYKKPATPYVEIKASASRKK